MRSESRVLEEKQAKGVSAVRPGGAHRDSRVQTRGNLLRPKSQALKSHIDLPAKSS